VQESSLVSNTYTEDQLVEQSAIGLFVELDWTRVKHSR